MGFAIPIEVNNILIYNSEIPGDVCITTLNQVNNWGINVQDESVNHGAAPHGISPEEQGAVILQNVRPQTAEIFSLDERFIKRVDCVLLWKPTEADWWSEASRKTDQIFGSFFNNGVVRIEDSREAEGEIDAYLKMNKRSAFELLAPFYKM